MKYRLMGLASLLWILPALFTLSVLGPRHARADGGCFPGTYIVKEDSGTQSLWTFSQDGTYQSASSAEVARNFGHVQGAWRKTGARELRAVGLDFNFSNDADDDVGVPPFRIARVDSVMSFTRKCEEVEGSFELRFFGPNEDPLRDNGEFIFSDTFTGQRVTVNY